MTGDYALLQAGAACTISNQSITKAANQTTPDSSYTYPAGLMNFTLQSCGSPSYTTTITQYYYGLTSSNLVLRKYNPTTKIYTTVTGATISHITINGQNVTRVSYDVTDGGPLDQDSTVNGVIVDPVGLAEATSLSGQNSGMLTDTGVNITTASIIAAVFATLAPMVLLWPRVKGLE